MMSRPKSIQGQQHQKGIVLAMSLIILLALTMIGISGTQVTSLTERMVANSKDYNLAFLSADSALKYAENILAASPPPNFSTSQNGLNGLYINTGGTAVYYDSESLNWSSSTTPATYSGSPLYGVISQPTYIVEQLGFKISDAPSDSLESSGAGTQQNEENYYRVTARGVGSNADTVVMVQSIYKR